MLTVAGGVEVKDRVLSVMPWRAAWPTWCFTWTYYLSIVAHVGADLVGYAHCHASAQEAESDVTNGALAVATHGIAPAVNDDFRQITCDT